VSLESRLSESGDRQTAPAAGQSPQEALPGLAAAFDEQQMRGHLQAALFGADSPSHTVDQCTPTRPLYVPGEYCLLRYRVRARSIASGDVLEPIVMGRVFPNQSACAAYMSAKLAPLAARMRNRPEVTAFAAPAAMIDALNMVVHVWPVDGELPTLVDATDPGRMIDVFRETLPGALSEPFMVDDCRIELVSYRRRQRCVLRYTIAGRTAAGLQVPRLVVYGKVTAFGDEALSSRMIEMLRDRIAEPAARHRFSLPRPMGSRPDLQMSLLEALPGRALVGSALKARLRGRSAPEALRLEELITTCGQVASMLHASGVTLGRPRTLDDDLLGLQGQITMVRQFAPAFGDQAQAWLERIAALAQRSEPLTLRLSHGDFKHEQLLFDGASTGLVDFDGICQAEPALDLGKFLAHLRTEVEKIQGRTSVSSPLGNELAERFLRTYVSAAGGRVKDEWRLRRRTSLYEAIALLRLALISQQDLDQPTLKVMTALVEERISVADLEHETSRRT
jgi:hypothetical protein